METNGQRLNEGLHQTGLCLPAQQCPGWPQQTASLLTALLLVAPLPPPTMTHDPCPGERRHRYDAIFLWRGPVVTAAKWPKQNKYRCLSQASAKFPKRSVGRNKFLFQWSLMLCINNTWYSYYYYGDSGIYLISHYVIYASTLEGTKDIQRDLVMQCTLSLQPFPICAESTSVPPSCQPTSAFKGLEKNHAPCLPLFPQP